MSVLLVLLPVVVAICAARLLATKLIVREQLYRDMVRLCDILEGEISFRQTQLAQVLGKFCETCSQYSRSNIDKFLSNIDSINPNIFKEESIGAFFSSLGRLDCETQLAHINRYRREFNDLWDSAKKNKSQYCPMYYKLAVLLGIGIGILLL